MQLYADLHRFIVWRLVIDLGRGEWGSLPDCPLNWACPGNSSLLDEESGIVQSCGLVGLVSSLMRGIPRSVAMHAY